jgi:tartrate dehydrogenase/decarboxylase/D-malate dehydrogenase
MMASFRIAVIAGDGIGREVIPAGMAAMAAAARGSDLTLSFSEFPWGCEFYKQHGRMLDDDGFERLAEFDAIYLGAIGAPGVSDAASAALILAIRQRFDQYVNLRPMRLLPGLASPLANRGAADIDMICVRENSEGEYSGVGGRIHRGTAHEVAQQVGVFTRNGIERILRYGFELAASRPRKLLASATKSNALTHSMVMWDEIAEIVRKDYPSVEYRKYHVDALAARMITHPQTLDVMVTSNLFGDILTDIGSAISGSLGIAPGANINPTRQFPSMFEPIHGSAPDLAG